MEFEAPFTPFTGPRLTFILGGNNGRWTLSFGIRPSDFVGGFPCDRNKAGARHEGSPALCGMWVIVKDVQIDDLAFRHVVCS